jgi:hypothetical protein
MEAIILQGGSAGAQLIALGVAVYFMSKRIDRIDKTISNGLTARINKMGESIARIQGQFEALPKRKTDTD